MLHYAYTCRQVSLPRPHDPPTEPIVTRPDPSQLTTAQLEIMQIVWDHGECSVTFLWEKLAESRSVARNTVLTMIQRLERRGYLSARAEGRAFRYRARVQRGRTERSRVKDLVDQVFDGSAERLVRSLLGEGMLDPDELSRLRGVLDEATARQDEHRTTGKAARPSTRRSKS